MLSVFMLSLVILSNVSPEIGEKTLNWNSPIWLKQQEWQVYSWLVVSSMFIFHFIYGMSSFPLTKSYFSRWLLHHQPVIVYSVLKMVIAPPTSVFSHHGLITIGSLLWIWLAAFAWRSLEPNSRWQFPEFWESKPPVNHRFTRLVELSWPVDKLAGGLEHGFYDFPYAGNVIIAFRGLIPYTYLGKFDHDLTAT